MDYGLSHNGAEGEEEQRFKKMWNKIRVALCCLRRLSIPGNDMVDMGTNQKCPCCSALPCGDIFTR